MWRQELYVEDMTLIKNAGGDAHGIAFRHFLLGQADAFR